MKNFDDFTPLKNLDDFDFEGDKPSGGKTSITEDLKTAVSSVLNTGDTGLSLAASVPARLFSGKETQDKLFKELNDRIESRNKWLTQKARSKG